MDRKALGRRHTVAVAVTLLRILVGTMRVLIAPVPQSRAGVVDHQQNHHFMCRITKERAGKISAMKSFVKLRVPPANCEKAGQCMTKISTNVKCCKCCSQLDADAWKFILGMALIFFSHIHTSTHGTSVLYLNPVGQFASDGWRLTNADWRLVQFTITTISIRQITSDVTRRACQYTNARFNT